MPVSFIIAFAYRIKGTYMRTWIAMLFSICLLLSPSLGKASALFDSDQPSNNHSSYQKQWDELMKGFQEQKAKLQNILEQVFKKSNSSYEEIKKEIEDIYGGANKSKPVVQQVMVPGQKK
jgi:hypothetical protein